MLVTDQCMLAPALRTISLSNHEICTSVAHSEHIFIIDQLSIDRSINVKTVLFEDVQHCARSWN